jgi:uncharacterized metal-binding protein YceD (DUF177 family)
MKQLKEFTIPFVGLKIGKHHFDYSIDQTFFNHFEYEDFNSCNIKVDLILEKKSTLLELNFQISGTVNVNCDVTNEPFDLPITTDFDLVVKFGDEYNDIYESVVLALPSKRIHPGVEDGTLDSEILDKLDELSPKLKDKKEDKEETDPRWNTLKKLLTDK